MSYFTNFLSLQHISYVKLSLSQTWTYLGKYISIIFNKVSPLPCRIKSAGLYLQSFTTQAIRIKTLWETGYNHLS